MPTDKLEDFILNHREDFDAEVPPANLWNRIETAMNTSDDDKDPLEGFVLDNRAAFDDTTPPPRLEGRVFAALAAEAPTEDIVAVDTAGATPIVPLRAVHGRRRRVLSIMGIAASFLLLLTAAFSLGSSRGYRAGQNDQIAAEIERIDPDLAAAEQYYRGEIDVHFTRVDASSDDPQLKQDLEAIDAATQEIRASLLEVPKSQRPALVNKLIATYRTKLDILLKVQQHLPTSAPTESRATPQTEENEL